MADNQSISETREKRRGTSIPPAPPDGGYGWVVVFAAFMINVIVDGIAYTFGIFNIEFEEHYKAGSGITSMVGSLLTGIYLFSGPLASFLINRFDSRLVTLVGAVIATIGFVFSWLSPNIKILMLTYGFIGGLGLGLMYLPAVVSVSFYFDKRRALTTGIVTCGTGVGSFIFAPLFEAIMRNNGWKYSMVIVALITLQGAVFGSLLRPLQPRTMQKKEKKKTDEPRQTSDSDDRHLQIVLNAKEGTRREAEEEMINGESVQNISKLDDQQTSIMGSLMIIPSGLGSGVISKEETTKKSFFVKTGLYLLADPLFLIPCLANLSAMLGHYIPFFFITHRAMLEIGSTQSQAALLLSITAVTNTLGRVLMGFLADFKWVNALLLHNIAITTSGLACILSMFCVNYGSTCVFAAYFGLCMATWIALSPIILCELLGLDKLTNAFGLLCCVRGISSFAGPPIAGMVYDVTKDYNNAFHVGGSLLFIGGLISCLLHLPHLQRKTYANTMLNREE